MHNLIMSILKTAGLQASGYFKSFVLKNLPLLGRNPIDVLGSLVKKIFKNKKGEK